MSGTSLDGLDLLLIEFDREFNYQLLKAQSLPYSSAWQKKLAFQPHISATQLLALNAEYGNFLASAVKDFLGGERVAFIASHGHTFFHDPRRAFTYQLGGGPELHQKTGFPVVCDFRQEDLTRGGQGAPLVPIGDRDLFADYDLCLNLGGFANLSYQQASLRKAADLLPCNLLLNAQARQLGLDYDKDGEIARSGKVIPILLKKLRERWQPRLNNPIALSAEWLNQYFLAGLDLHGHPVEDLLATFSQYIAETLARVIDEIGGEALLVTGGGAHNQYLINTLRSLSPVKIVLPDPWIIDFKEALIFIYLGWLRLKGRDNILASVTGADHDHCAGRIYGSHSFSNS